RCRHQLVLRHQGRWELVAHLVSEQFDGIAGELAQDLLWEPFGRWIDRYQAPRVQRVGVYRFPLRVLHLQAAAKSRHLAAERQLAGAAQRPRQERLAPPDDPQRARVVADDGLRRLAPANCRGPGGPDVRDDALLLTDHQL